MATLECKPEEGAGAPDTFAAVGKLLSKWEDEDYKNGLRTPRFLFRSIEPLRDVTMRQIYDYLERIECPVKETIAGLIFDRTKGRYEETVSLLQRGLLSWYSLKEELDGNADAAAGEEPGF
jgi:hypothetical protein